MAWGPGTDEAVLLERWTMKTCRWACLLLLGVIALDCTATTEAPPPQVDTPTVLGLTFNSQPAHVTPPAQSTGSNRAFVRGVMSAFGFGGLVPQAQAIKPSPQTTGAIRELAGGPIALYVGPNIRADVEWTKKFKASIENDPKMLEIYGGKEMLEISTDVSSRTVRPFAAMLKKHFPDIRVAGSLAEAEKLASVTVIVDTYTEGAYTSRFWSELYFLVPSSSRSVHRTIETTVRKSCPGSIGNAQESHKCFRAAEDQMYSELAGKLDEALR